MAMMKKFKDEVIRINDIGDIYVVLSEMVDVLVDSLHNKSASRYASFSSYCEDDYQNLEKLVQKHEAEIRNHIRTEQQLRLYIENMEIESETKLAAMEKELLKVKSDNKYLLEKVVKHRKELSFARPSSKEKSVKESADDHKLPSNGTMVGQEVTEEGLLRKLQKSETYLIIHHYDQNGPNEDEYCQEVADR